MIGFLPTPDGPFHMGTLSTYFASWLLSRRRREQLVVAPDVQVKNKHLFGDIMAWRDEAMMCLDRFGIMPDLFLEPAAVWAKRFDDVPYDVSVRAYPCQCGDRPTPDRYPMDPCRVSPPVREPGMCLRLRGCGVRVAEVGLAGIRANDVLEHVMLQRRLGFTTIVRANDLADHAQTQRLVQEAADWTPVETVFCPVIWTFFYQKLAKSNGAEPALAAVDEPNGWTPLEVLRALWEGLQVRSSAPHTLADMAREFEPARLNPGDYRWEDCRKRHNVDQSARMG